MGVWNTYEARLGVPQNASENAKRDSGLDHVQDRLRRKLVASLSYKEVKIGGEERKVAVIEEEEFTTKKIVSLPNEDLEHGAIVDWADEKWLITEVNSHKEVCTEGKMRQCNYLLKWIDDTGNVISKWCVVEDGTKYLIGEKNSDMITIGDARIAITLGKDRDTVKLSRGRRFLVDDMDSQEVLAYQITKPNKLFNVYGGKGVFRFILNEVNVTDDDNTELRIADYYSWKPKTKRAKPDVQVDSVLEKIVTDAVEKKKNTPADIEERKVWL